MKAHTFSPKTDFDFDRAAHDFERAWGDDVAPRLAAFLPPRGHTRYERTLCELLRIDLKMRRSRNRQKRLKHYRSEFPELFRNTALIQELAYEELQQRMRAGDLIDVGEYERHFGLDVHNLLESSSPKTSLQRHDATQFVAAREIHRDLAGMIQERADVLRSLRQSAPELAKRIEAAAAELPTCGQTLCGFELTRELGQGAFAKVFLARQSDLANRQVALKVTPTVQHEPQTLARLQHTNIVPIYSVHKVGALQAVCMPYLGSLTLAGVVRDLSRHRGTLPSSGRDLLSTLFGQRSTVAEIGKLKTDEISHPTATPTLTASPILDMLASFDHIETVLWLGARLADGLEHAHERGILHLDLKPANVLLTDDGQPMLLDFNLAIDANGPVPIEIARMGGTLPYMPVEQLEAFRGGKRALDGRCDLFALGVIMFELLSGHLPFPYRRGSVDYVVEEMIGDRRKRKVSVRELNSAIPAAVDSIIQKLLSPNPADRYRNGAQLREDLECQLTNRPLKYAPDRSVKERFHKWRRRHPRLSAAAIVGVLATLLLLLPATVVMIRHNQMAQRRMQIETAEATLKANDIGREARTVQALLATRGNRELLNQGLERGKAVFGRYGIENDPDWKQKPSFARIPVEKQNELRADFGELAMLMCRAEQLRASDADPDERMSVLNRALGWNRVAEQCFLVDKVPAMLARQRSAVLSDLGEGNVELPSTISTVVEDGYHDAVSLVSQGRYRDAVAALRPFTEANPKNFQAWFLRGHCHDVLAQFTQSDACWSVCTALEPDMPWTWFNRGVVRMQLPDYAGAEADFTKALELKPEWIEARMDRAIARKNIKKYVNALDDMKIVIAADRPPVRAWFVRAEIHELQGETAAAARDRVEGMKREPADELSWSTRGYARMSKEPVRALADIDRALTLNPSSREALVNKSVILSEYLNRPKEAVLVLDRFLQLYPDHVPARAGRGVVLARIGECRKARADAERCLQHERSGFLQYQLAGLYAQISRHESARDAKDEALRLLGNALRSGFADLETWKSDSDLDPIRNEPEFKRLQEVLAGLKLSSSR